MFWWISFFLQWNWLGGSRANCELSIIMNPSEVCGTSVKLPSKWNIWLKRLKKLTRTNTPLVFGSLWHQEFMKGCYCQITVGEFGCTQIRTSISCCSKKKKYFGNRFFVFCLEVQLAIGQKSPKKTFGRFMGHSGHYFGQILGLKNLAGAFLSKHLNCWLCTSALKLI